MLNDYIGASLVAQTVKRLPAMRETRVRFLGREDPLEKEMAVHSSILAWRLPWTEEAGGLQSVGSQESDTTKRLNQHKRLGRLQAASVSGLTRSSGPALSPPKLTLGSHQPTSSLQP